MCWCFHLFVQCLRDVTRGCFFPFLSFFLRIRIFSVHSILIWFFQIYSSCVKHWYFIIYKCNSDHKELLSYAHHWRFWHPIPTLCPNLCWREKLSHRYRMILGFIFWTNDMTSLGLGDVSTVWGYLQCSAREKDSAEVYSEKAGTATAYPGSCPACSSPAGLPVRRCPLNIHPM